MPLDHLPLDRRFDTIVAGDGTVEIDHDGRVVASFGEAPISWSTILDWPRVVVLGPAGSGKTAEIKDRAAALRRKGHQAFFLPLDELASQELERVVASQDLREALDCWRMKASEPAWFFLDARDELVFSNSRLRRALESVRHGLGDSLSRARVVLTSRPHEWNGVHDRQTLQELLPVPITDAARSQPSSESMPIMVGGEVPAESIGEETASDAADSVRVVSLKPLDSRQIRSLAEHWGASDVDAFIGAVREPTVREMYERPRALRGALRLWNATGSLGSVVDQRDRTIRETLADERPEVREAVSPERLIDGAARLALARFLTRRPLISAIASDDTYGEDAPAIHAGEVLSDFTSAERSSLLGRGLFSPVTESTVRFAEVELAEYLAAVALRKLLVADDERQMSQRDVERLLFSERYGHRVALPSMRAVGSWLALWSEPTRRRLVEIDPIALVVHADPASLDRPTRRSLVATVCERLALDPGAEVAGAMMQAARLAASDLGETIADCWSDSESDRRVRSFLLDCIRVGRVTACLPQIREVLAAGLESREFAPALEALISCADPTEIAEYVVQLVERARAGPAALIETAIGALFPHHMTNDQLGILLEALREHAGPAHREFSRLRWEFPVLVEAIVISSERTVPLRDLLTHLLMTSGSRSTWHAGGNEFQHRVAPALDRLCTRMIDGGVDLEHPALVRACSLAVRFGRQLDDSGPTITRRYAEAPARTRRIAFTVIARLEAEVDVLHERQWPSTFPTDLIDPSADDHDWLEELLARDVDSGLRRTALSQYLRLAIALDTESSRVSRVRERICDDPDLVALYDAWIDQPTPSETDDPEPTESVDTEAAWRKWRAGVVSKPEAAFSPNRRVNTLLNLHRDLSVSDALTDQSRAWNLDTVASCYSEDVADRARTALAEMWRKAVPRLVSRRAREDMNRVYYADMLSLAAVNIEAQSSGWEERLSSDEALRAAEYALLEIDNVAPFVGPLSESHPDAVAEAIGGELLRQVGNDTEMNATHLLQKLTRASTPVNDVVATYLVEALTGLADGTYQPDDVVLQGYLSSIGAIATTLSSVDRRAEIARIAAERFKIDPVASDAGYWLHLLGQVDTPLMIDRLEDIGELAGRRKYDTRWAVPLVAALNDQVSPLDVGSLTSAEQASVLARLYRFARRWIRREHDGPLEMGVRDLHRRSTRKDAQSARESFLDRLAKQSGAAPYAELLALAADLDHLDERPFITRLAANLAARDADRSTRTPDEVRTLVASATVAPVDAATLRLATLDAIQEVERFFGHDPLSTRATWAKVTEEGQVQREFASRLRDRNRRKFNVVLESEVVDSKRIDIEILTRPGAARAAIEVKIAFHWTPRELLFALREQLLGRYLRDETCRVGVLLVVRTVPKPRRHPETRKDMDFPELIDWLNTHARTLEREHAREVQLDVVGVDLNEIR